MSDEEQVVSEEELQTEGGIALVDDDDTADVVEDDADEAKKIAKEAGIIDEDPLEGESETDPEEDAYFYQDKYDER